ncbi:MAG: heparan-alpha-glucosaminide N-acetyltransferase domain-containing protein [Bacteroidetes bacterium]|nr:heparan-alpha-glucosaminide N-acetyltransferase domain-containing protein [Bacteroidota bacterium]
MTTLTKPRIQSIDLLKGLVMVIMALDHVRDYFHYSAFYFDATDPEQTTWPIFITRFITHFCAPAFSFLAGTSAFMIGKRKLPAELSSFLFKRGLWLVFVEIIIINFAWKFDLNFTHIGLQTIWSLGISMIVLSGLIYLPKKVILAFSIVIIFGHNMLDNIHFEGSYLWSILHEWKQFEFIEGHKVLFAYSLLPWIAVMSLGYCFGSLYDSSFDVKKRKRILNNLGIGSLVLFFIFIAINKYGNPVQWTNYGITSKTLMSIFNINKYPPSLLYLLITLGGTFLFLANAEKLKGKVVDFFCVFGRVPFFYYILHIYLIHLIAVIAAELTGFGWEIMVSLPTFIVRVEALKGYGFNLITVYVVWIIVILLLYPLCKKFDNYKQSHKEKWWLSYL